MNISEGKSQGTPLNPLQSLQMELGGGAGALVNEKLQRHSGDVRNAPSNFQAAATS